MSAPAPTALPRIGYVLKRYPRVSETFVVNQILAHDAAGQEIDIFALRPVQETHSQDAISRVRAAGDPCPRPAPHARHAVVRTRPGRGRDPRGGGAGDGRGRLGR